MGAATVLLFAVPHGPLSQPWPLFGGNLISALVGVLCAQFISDIYIAAAMAVAVAVILMYYLKCIHPPGGATALSAVVGGPAVSALGFQYIITPVLLNVIIIFSVAVLFNFPFKWRRYPASMIEAEQQVPEVMFTHLAIEHAMHQLDTFVDVSEDDLQRIYYLAREYDQKFGSDLSGNASVRGKEDK